MLIQLDLGLKSLESPQLALVGRPLGKNRSGTAQPYTYAQASGETLKLGEMEARWGLSLGEMVPLGGHMVPETPHANQPMLFSSGRLMDVGGRSLSPHPGQLGYAFDIGCFQQPPRTSSNLYTQARQITNLAGEPMTQWAFHDQLPEESNSGEDQMPFPQTNQPEPIRTRLLPGHCDSATLNLGEPSANGVFTGTLEEMHMQAMYPHLVGPGGSISFVTGHLNLVEQYTPTMQVPLLRNFLKGLTPTMVRLLGEIISEIQDEANFSTAGVGKFDLSIKRPVNNF